MGRHQRRLILQGLRARPARTVLTLLTALLIAAASTALVVTSSTVLAVVERGAIASSGGRAYVVGTANDDVVSHLDAQVAEGTALAQARGAGQVGAGTGTSSGTILLLSGPSAYGEVLDGRHPASPGEVSVSAELARRLGLGPGDGVDASSSDLDLAGTSLTVVGVVLDPASPGSTELVAVMEPDLVAAQATTWLTDTDPCLQQSLAASCGSGAISISTRDLIVERALEDAGSRLLSGVKPFAGLLLLVAVIALGASMSADRRAAVPLARALEAAGASARRARHLSRAGGRGVLLLGTPAGAGLAHLVLTLLCSQIGTLLSQRWDHLETSVLRVAGFIGAYLLLAAGIDVAAGQRHRWASRPTSAAVPRRRLLLASAGCGTALSVVLVYLRLEEHHWLPEGNALGALVLSLSLPVLLWLLPWLRRTPVQALAARYGLAALVPVLMATMMLQGFASFYSASLWSSLAGGGALHEDRSLTAQGLTVQDVSALTQAYPQVMQDAVVLTTVAEAPEQPRVSRAQEASCTTSACFTFLGAVALAPASGPGAVLAGTLNAELDNAAGEVGLVRFVPATGHVASTSTISVSTRSDLLTDYPVLPDVVLAPDDPQVAALGLRPTEGRVLFVEDFQSLPDGVRDGFRSNVTTRSGYAWVTEADSTELRQLRSQAVTVPLVAAVLSLAALGLGLLSLLERLRPLLVVLDDRGSGTGAYLRLVLPALVTLVVCSGAPVLLSRWAAQPAVLMSMTPLHFDFGAWWWAPALAGPGAGVALAGVLARCRAPLGARPPAQSLLGRRNTAPSGGTRRRTEAGRPFHGSSSASTWPRLPTPDPPYSGASVLMTSSQPPAKGRPTR